MSKEKFFRPYQSAWDKRHLKQFGTKLTAKQAERVRAACDREQGPGPQGRHQCPAG